MLNLFIAIIVNAMQSMNEAEHADEKHAQALEHKTETEWLHQKLDSLQTELQFIKAQLTKGG